MKKAIIIAIFALCSLSAAAWGPRGHRIVACIADENVKPSTRKEVERYLGRSMGFYATWMDEFREDPAYEFSSSCHTFRVDDEFKYAPKEGKLDALSLLDQAVAVVKDRRNQTDSAVTVNLKFIIHLVGDMHCPSHVKYAGIKTNFKVCPSKEGSQSSYHSVWDAEIVDRKSGGFSPDYIAHDLDRLSRKEIAELQKGSPLDWAEQNAVDVAVIYDMVEEGEVLKKSFYNAAWPIAQQQLIRAGYRLAKVLDDCFAK